MAATTKNRAVVRGLGGLLLATALGAPAVAGQLNPSGDGSDYNNPDLTRDLTGACEDCLAVAPRDVDEPLLDLDWSLGLRGGITQRGDTTSYEVIALPSLTLKQQTIRGGYDFGADADLSYTDGETARINALGVSAGGNYQIDSVTNVAGRGTLSVSQDDPGSSSEYATNVAAAPVVVSGTGEASLTRDLGLFDLELRGSAARTGYGETVYDDASTTDNSFQNTTSFGAGGRIGVKLTPGLTAFVDGEATADRYDAVSPSLLMKLDGTTYEARTGLNFKLRETLELEGSIGVAYRDFADAGLEDFTAVLYGAKAVFRPDETLSLTGELTTNVAAPGTTSGASARVEYAATGEAAYLVNPWLRLRAKTGWSEAQLAAVDAEELRWTAGMGLDYLLNEHTDLTADYGFARSKIGADPETDEHSVTLGVTFHR